MVISLKNRERLITVIALLSLLTAYHFAFHNFFPFPNGLMGHDYSLFLPMFIDNYFWFTKNGLMPAWFTPTFCGGQVNFADPQSMYYSLPQFLVFANIEIITAIYVSVLIFAVLGFAGMFLLTRKTFTFTLPASLICAAIFMFNDFYSYRMIVGHITFQGFMLTPLIAYCLLSKCASRSRHIAQVSIAGIMLAYWFLSGMAVIIAPCLLAVSTIAFICFIYQKPFLKTFVINTLLAGVISLGLAAAKLAGALKLLTTFPRTEYTLPGFDNFLDMLSVFYSNLFGNGIAAAELALPLWKNASLPLPPHEMAFGLTPAPLLLIGISAGFIFYQYCWRNRTPIELRKYITVWWLPLIFILIIPAAITYYTPQWNTFLKTLPIVAESASPQRWILIYMFVIILLTGVAVNRLPHKMAWLATIIALILLPWQLFKTPRTDEMPDIMPVWHLSALFENAKLNKMTHQIKVNGNVVPDILAGRNYLAIQGYGILNCYNPTYGYFLEKMSRDGIAVGPPLNEATPGRLNIRNPSCILFPEENNCKIWDNFTTAQRDSAEAFLDYRPFKFSISATQQIANAITQLSLYIVTLLLVWPLCKLIKRKFF